MRNRVTPDRLVNPLALLLASLLLVAGATGTAAAETPSELIEEFPRLSEDQQLSLDTGEKIYKQSCANCHGTDGQGGYLVYGVEAPPLAEANGYVEELEEEDFADATIPEGHTWEDLAYATIREHTRKPPGVMANAVGSDGWSTDVISEAEADAMARWLIEEAPEAEQPGEFDEEQFAGGEETVDELKDEFSILPESEQLPLEEGETIFERSCANCHESDATFAGPPSVPVEDEEHAPPLAPKEREEEGMALQTYYHMREHIRKPPKLMAHYIQDTSTGEIGWSTDTISEAEADAVARFIALDEGDASSLNEETGLPPKYSLEEEPTETATAAPEEEMTEEQTEDSGGQTSPGFTGLAAVTGLLAVTYILRRRR